MTRSGDALRLHVLVDRARSSLWFVPAVMVLGAIALSSGLLVLDARLAVRHPATQWWLFGGNAEGARTLLSVIAGSLITVISVAFSVTMIAIQQASTQYTPRVLRNYTKDRGNQVVLGIYLATFTFSLLVLREVREAGDDSPGFVPTWSMLAAMLLALTSLAALIYFMHHVSESLQVSYLLARIRAEVDAQIAALFPETLGERAREAAGARAPPLAGEPVEVRAGREGYLRRVDEEALARACEGLEVVIVPVQIGDRLRRDTVVAQGWPARAEDAGRIAAAFEVDRYRTTEQDVLFGLRQLADIAVKALSPGVNDPTTAEQALEEIVGALAQLVAREMPDPHRVRGGTRFRFEVLTFERVVDEALSQIRRAAAPHVHVTVAFLHGVRAVAERAPTAARVAPLRGQVEQVMEALPSARFTGADEAEVRRAATAVLRVGIVGAPDAGREHVH